MPIVVGPGLKALMDANGDAPLAYHVWDKNQVDDNGTPYEIEKCLGSKGLYVSSNIDGVWQNAGPLPVAV